MDVELVGKYCLLLARTGLALALCGCVSTSINAVEALLPGTNTSDNNSAVLTAPVVPARPNIPREKTSVPIALPKHVLRAGPFILTTEIPLTRRDPLVLDLLGLRQALHETLRLPLGREIVRIVIFAERDRYRAFMSQHFPDLPDRRAYYIKEGNDSAIVLTCQSEHLQRDLRHEATHALVNAVLPRVPLWLDEGLAEYFELGPDHRGINATHVARLRAVFAQNTAEILAPTPANNPFKSPSLTALEKLLDIWQMTPHHYRESWLWVHFCLHHSATTKQALLTHLQLLRNGKTDSLAARLKNETVDPHPQVQKHLDNLAAYAIQLQLADDNRDQRDSYHRPPLEALGASLRNFGRWLTPGNDTPPLGN